MTQEPNRLASAMSDLEREMLGRALDHTCSACSAEPGVWCFRAGLSGTWTMHGERLLSWAKPV